MTTCCWRLTQPETRRRKKARGEGTASMSPQLPQEAPTLQGWSRTGMMTPVAGGRLVPGRRAPPASVATSGRVFAQDGTSFFGSAPCEIGGTKFTPRGRRNQAPQSGKVRVETHSRLPSGKEGHKLRGWPLYNSGQTFVSRDIQRRFHGGLLAAGEKLSITSPYDDLILLCH